MWLNCFTQQDMGCHGFTEQLLHAGFHVRFPPDTRKVLLLWFLVRHSEGMGIELSQLWGAQMEVERVS